MVFGGIVSVNEIIVGIQADRPHEKINIWRGHCVGLVRRADAK